MRSNTGRKRINILGALNINDYSTITTLTEESCNSERIIEFFKKIRDAYPGKKIVIVMDNASYNRANLTRDHAEEHNIMRLFLPPYAPNLNLIERLWKFTKKKLVNNKYYETFNQFVDATERYFKKLNDFQQELASIFTQKFQIVRAV